MYRYFERVLFNPKGFDYILILLLMPFALIYGTINLIRVKLIREKDFNIPIIGIGNIVIGGSGKTPFAKFLINYLNEKKGCKIAYISRGYGRVSRGFVEVKVDGKILTNVLESGDEAMMIAKECNCDVYVSENREEAILKAKENGAKIVVLDDAFSQVGIKKFDIVLEPKNLANRLPLPAGGLREFYFCINRANLIAKEGKDFKRLIFYENLTPKMVLTTAISKPNRLDPILPKGVVAKHYFSDHAFFDEDELKKILDRYDAISLLVTQKDYVKMEQFKLPISKIRLKLQVDSKILNEIDKYLGDLDCKQK